MSPTKSRKNSLIQAQQKYTATFRLQRYDFRPNKEKVFQRESFICATMPPIPVPSEELKKLLIQFNTLNEPSILLNDFKRVKTKGKQITNFGKINGFIAFRSFYCKNIKNSVHQILLSSELANIWRDEINKKTWSLYAYLYNVRDDKSIPFVIWLCETLRMKSTFKPSIQRDLHTIKNNTTLYGTMNFKDAVEDVYFTKSDMFLSQQCEFLENK
uniref:MAT alpha 1 protein n=1 Tax=Suhomyces emberorum TaxID=246006 RepID=A0A3S9NLX3_9ASCO|nr:MAT alpha 1 protein [Suhomyces emberorum]